ncbi:MAG: hypothetical protein R3C05_07135 [Pirellulaceae bacterium]
MSYGQEKALQSADRSLHGQAASPGVRRLDWRLWFRSELRDAGAEGAAPFRRAQTAVDTGSAKNRVFRLDALDY